MTGMVIKGCTGRAAVAAFGPDTADVTFESPATPERLFFAACAARGTVTRVTLADLNAADPVRFATLLQGVFEHSPWVAEGASTAGPFPSLEALHAALVDVVERADRERQLALLRAHPDLGTRLRMSRASTSEQARAGLTALPPADLRRLLALNAAYHERFAFPFIYAVRGSTPAQIVGALEARLSQAPDREFQEALRQVYRIARFRLEAAIDA